LVDRDERRHKLFLNRIDFVCMSEGLKIAMVRETGCKQFKRYFINYYGMNDTISQHNADKYNEGSRIYKKFPTIVNNCSKFPEIDIKDFTLHEMFLASNLSWVMRRNAAIQSKKRIKGKSPAFTVVDDIDVQQTVDKILNSNWYAAVKENPALVATVMNRISDTVVNNSIYSSKR
jgi:hypothetical protein